MITIQIQRFDSTNMPQQHTQSYQVPSGLTLLQALQYIKTNSDATLSFNAGCRSGICGVCSVRVNAREELACSYKVQEGDNISPLEYHTVVRDLIVNKKTAQETLQRASTWLHQEQKVNITIADEKVTELQSDCILCNICYSACPVYAVNPKFLGPFALTRAYRYSADKREADVKATIDAIQDNGVWDCTLCGECTAVCPQGIDPKMDITMLRSTSTQFGYMDPNFQTMNFGF